jgi:cellulose synthase/poly-beta-1,6-N-acetylglucosamine synthase-like glycosyltransferase
MLRVVAWLGQFLIVVPALYSAVISLWGMRNQPRTEPSSGSRSIRCVVAAHDEEAVIGGIAADLSSQIYPPERLRCVVVADRCTDETAVVASQYVEVAVRSGGTGGKGAAIAWYLESDPLAEGEILAVFDADNRLPEDFVQRLATPFDSGSAAVQTYLDVTNPDGSALATANALTYWASNRMVQLARSNIGWSCDLGGTGMAISGDALEVIGGISDHLTDDLALNVRLNLAGYHTAWLHDVRIKDEKPTGAASTVRQRARWVSGKRSVQRMYGRRLFSTGLRRWRPNLLDMGFRLYNPGRSFIALLVAGLAFLAALLPEAGLLPWQYLAAFAAVIVLLPVVFLVREGIEMKYIIRYPVVAVIALLWIPIRIASRFTTSWRRTPHSG